MIRQVMYGVAVADAIGNPLEFKTAPTPHDFVVAATSPLVVSDDTQMMMFSLEAMVFGWSFEEAYTRWYYTQMGWWGDWKTGLMNFSEMFDVQSPGNTCITSCKSIFGKRLVTNNSKGNGTVMRCAHIAHWCKVHGFDLDEALTLARVDAETTHKHPLAALCSEALTYLHWRLASGLSLTYAVEYMLDRYSPSFPAPILCLMRGMLEEYNKRERGLFDKARQDLGGWVAEEALALAIGASLNNEDYLEAVYDASMIQGDSDTVAAITGGLMAATGKTAPLHLVESLNVSPAINWLLELDDCS